MRIADRVAASLFLLFLILAGPALACGDSEAPSSCDEGGGERAAKWMLGRVVSAIDRDEAAALGQFTRGEAGFRTADTYVFCVGPDGVMSAHPNPMLRGQDVRDLHDETGNRFIATMLADARPGRVSEIHYLFPRPGSETSVGKTTWYTRARDQVCGVGVYDGDERTAAAPSPEARLAQLRGQLDRGMPASLRADWAAFLDALNQRDGAQDQALARARASVQAAAAALAPAH